MYRITSPVKGYSGTGYGLAFAQGVTSTKDSRIAGLLERRGYTVEEVADPEPVKEQQAQAEQEQQAQAEQEQQIQEAQEQPEPEKPEESPPGGSGKKQKDGK